MVQRVQKKGGGYIKKKSKDIIVQFKDIENKKTYDDKTMGSKR